MLPITAMPTSAQQKLATQLLLVKRKASLVRRMQIAAMLPNTAIKEIWTGLTKSATNMNASVNEPHKARIVRLKLDAVALT